MIDLPNHVIDSNLPTICNSNTAKPSVDLSLLRVTCRPDILFALNEANILLDSLKYIIKQPNISSNICETLLTLAFISGRPILGMIVHHTSSLLLLIGHISAISLKIILLPHKVWSTLVGVDKPNTDVLYPLWPYSLLVHQSYKIQVSTSIICSCLWCQQTIILLAYLSWQP